MKQGRTTSPARARDNQITTGERDAPGRVAGAITSLIITSVALAAGHLAAAVTTGAAPRSSPLATPLPFEHGFPVRMLVPGLFGYESATRWIVDMELMTLESFHAYWVKRGWVQQVPVKTSSSVDTPSSSAKVAAGPVVVAGVAWAQDRGVGKVEVQVDGGGWAPATLGAEDAIDTWRQWKWQ